MNFNYKHDNYAAEKESFLQKEAYGIAQQSKQSTLSYLFDENSKLCASIEEKLNRLEETLSCILVSPLPMPAEKALRSSPESKTELEHRLENRNHALLDILFRINSITDRISL